MIFDQQIIQGDRPENKQCIIYFSCDPQYWAEYGQYLARSTLYYNGKQSHVHVHMIYEEGQEHPMKHLIKMQVSHIHLKDNQKIFMISLN